jgi:cobyrinic acid a,c-diamide synthase
MTGFLIAGTSSGVGKTTVTLAITAALRRRGLIVQPFKGGPDFLDSGHHTRIAGRVSRNLDTWMLSHESNRDVLRQASHGADVLIVEGMMGLFDGKSGADETGSSAEIAKLLKLPVVLVVDAGKSARSIAAVVLGFETFDPELPLAGVILNRVAGERHFKMLEAAILTRCSMPILGWLPPEPSVSIPERHLGLHTAAEQLTSELEQQIDALAKLAENHLAIDRLLALPCGLELNAATAAYSVTKPRVRIGVARDAAFTFYYEDNFDLLREEGAEIVPFSPLHDSDLPPALDALYLGGGYPELHAAALSGNTSMLDSVRTFAASQRPIYAECGGMMYLADSLTTKEGQTFNLAGLLPIQVEMTTRLVRFGYVTVEFTRDCLLGPAGTVIRGHSFHYSNITGTQNLSSSYRIDYSLSGQQEDEGFGISTANILASYIHLHFRANPGVAKHFVAAAIAAHS